MRTFLSALGLLPYDSGTGSERYGGKART